MLKRDKVLLGVTIGVAVLDVGLATGAYIKKKGIVVRDMALSALDNKLHPKQTEEETEAEEIPIE